MTKRFFFYFRPLKRLIFSKRSAAQDAPIFQCICMLAQAAGVLLATAMVDLLNSIFAAGLNEPVRAALVSLGKNIPSLLAPIQGTFFCNSSK